MAAQYSQRPLFRDWLAGASFNEMARLRFFAGRWHRWVGVRGWWWTRSIRSRTPRPCPSRPSARWTCSCACRTGQPRCARPIAANQRRFPTHHPPIPISSQNVQFSIQCMHVIGRPFPFLFATQAVVSGNGMDGQRMAPAGGFFRTTVPEGKTTLTVDFKPQASASLRSYPPCAPACSPVLCCAALRFGFCSKRRQARNWRSLHTARDAARRFACVPPKVFP